MKISTTKARLVLAAWLSVACGTPAPSPDSPGNPGGVLDTHKGLLIDRCADFQLTNDNSPQFRAKCHAYQDYQAWSQTSIGLDNCLGNTDDHIEWQYLGGAFASLKAWHLGKEWDSRNLYVLHKDSNIESVDLNEQIWVDDNGNLNCFDYNNQASDYQIAWPWR